MDEELFKRVLAFAGHKHNCDFLEPMWHQGPCDCGWAELEKELITRGILPPPKEGRDAYGREL